jgi:hypothetical protein
MSEYSFITDNIKFSYSGVTTFENCPHSYKLTYIDVENKIENAFGQFGLLVHHVLERYFAKEIDVWDLADYYKQKYDEFVTVPYPPNNYVDLGHSYFQAGLDFFTMFDFDRRGYEVVSIEDNIEFDMTTDIKAVARPDLVLKEIETGKYILFDYKTAKMKKTKPQLKKQISDYMRQMKLYCYAVWLKTGIEINEVRLWFIRDNFIYKEQIDSMDISDTTTWFVELINKIKEEQNWYPLDIEKNEFFCAFICSVRNSCRYFSNLD